MMSKVLLLLTACQVGPSRSGRWATVSDGSSHNKTRDELLHEVLRDAHPPIPYTDFDLEDFLWTGSDDDYDYNEVSPHDDDPVTGVSRPPHVTQAIPPVFPSKSGRADDVLARPTPTLIPVPEEEFLIRTVLLSNMTVIHNGIEGFKQEMEEKLTKAYRHAYVVNRYRRQARSRREEAQVWPMVSIHNIRSSLPEPEIEMIYTVARENQLIPAEQAASALCHVSDSEVSQVLGFPLITKAEPYKAPRPPMAHHTDGNSSRSGLLVAAAAVSSVLAIAAFAALLALLIFKKFNRPGGGMRHLLGSPAHASTSSGGARHSSLDGSLDQSAFTLDKKVKNGLEITNRPSSPKPNGRSATDAVLHSSGEDLFTLAKDGGRLSATFSRTSSLLDESPSMADLSSNNTPEAQKRKAKRKPQKRHQKNKRVGTPKVDQSTFPVRTPDKEGWIGPLSDLLEEEITLPGEGDRQATSPTDKGRNWAFLPDRTTTSPSSDTSSASSSCSASPSSGCSHRAADEELTWEEKVEASGDGEACERGNLVVKEPPSPEVKTRAISAKSHIFRKGKVEAARLPDARATTHRPWSAHESRLQADPIFSMRKRHWERLCQGKKTLHHGQLLPGSTSEEELKEHFKTRPYNKTGPSTTTAATTVCWSECASPRKQVRIQEPEVTRTHSPPAPEPTEPIIQAIHEELQRFKRQPPNLLAPVSVITDDTSKKVEDI